MEEPANSGENEVRNEDGTFKKGVSGNPNGRPKGSYSLKTKIIKLLEEKPELEKKLIEDLFEKEQSLMWQMIDGRPLQKSEIDMEANVQTGVVILPPKNDNASPI